MNKMATPTFRLPKPIQEATVAGSHQIAQHTTEFVPFDSRNSAPTGSVVSWLPRSTAPRETLTGPSDEFSSLLNNKHYTINIQYVTVTGTILAIQETTVNGPNAQLAVMETSPLVRVEVSSSTPSSSPTTFNHDSATQDIPTQHTTPHTNSNANTITIDSVDQVSESDMTPGMRETKLVVQTLVTLLAVAVVFVVAG